MISLDSEIISRGSWVREGCKRQALTLTFSQREREKASALLQCCQRVDPLPEADRISFIYQLMVSKAGFNAAQSRSARCLAEYRHPGARQICSSDLSQCRLAANRFSQLFRETIFGQRPDVGKRLINDILRDHLHPAL